MSNDLVLMDMQPGIEKLLSRAKTRYLDCKDLSIEEAEQLGDVLAVMQEYVLFWCGDLARYSEARWPDTHQQVWPPTVSPGMLARTAGTCKAYPTQEDRPHSCTYSQYKDVAGKPDRQKLLSEMVGQTTDESRGRVSPTPSTTTSVPPRPAPSPDPSMTTTGPRWLLAIDVHYYLNAFYHSGAGVEAATQVSSWVTRTVERLREKGLTDVACCFDSPTNNRKELTKHWEHQYKGNRGPKEPELIQQLHVVRSLLEKAGFCCVTFDGYEADDCIASYAKTFAGKVAILSGDKDMKQCLDEERVVMLLDVTWKEDDTSGELLPEYHWYTEKKHSRIECRNLLDDTGLTPRQFIDMQCLQGDSSDNIKGFAGIGETGAMKLIQTYGTVEAAIQAAKDRDERLLSMKRGKIMTASLLEYEPTLEVVRKLVTLRTDLAVPNSTRI